ncbi:MAG: tRNA (adenosine(37)-N6)-dimethylallyltransferase MiaA [Bacteroidota bacterium]|nr:tRNA (adenosine(37)-N6)-dimethylallyltransferase MiaA [Bacteroidota bacterium]
MTQACNLIVILGPTATGKTALAAYLADKLGTEMISADSRQVYRGMDIGTGKDYEDYIVAGKQVPVHLVDIVDAGYKYNVYEYQRDFFRIFQDLEIEKKLPVLCGGTGLYIEAVLKGYKLIKVPDNMKLRDSLKDKSMIELKEQLMSFKKLHNTTDLKHRKRLMRAIEIETYYACHSEEESDTPQIRPLIIGTKLNREERRRRITKRLRKRLDEGMLEEVRNLLAGGVSKETLIYYGLEYKYLAMYLDGKLNFEEMFGQLETAIHRFAKRQMTWFRGMEKRGFTIHWVDALAPKEENVDIIQRKLLK